MNPIVSGKPSGWLRNSSDLRLPMLLSSLPFAISRFAGFMDKTTALPWKEGHGSPVMEQRCGYPNSSMPVVDGGITLSVGANEAVRLTK
jgi:hypothetical protein